VRTRTSLHSWFRYNLSDSRESYFVIMSFRANVGDRLAELKSVASSLKSEGYTQISLYGFCWGGKVATVAAGEKDLFKSVAIVHPAMLDVKDVDGIEVPFGFYPSKVSIGMLEHGDFSHWRPY
jgi:dienelactone hydrolase